MGWPAYMVLGVAESSTSLRGQAALDLFVRQLVVGSLRDEGDEDLEWIFRDPFFELGDWVFVTKLAFATELGRFRWKFHESWATNIDVWKRHGVAGAVLAGMSEDVEFYLVYAGELVDAVRDSILLGRPGEGKELERWKDQWKEYADELKLVQ